jgi:hypothetical protein
MGVSHRVASRRRTPATTFFADRCADGTRPQQIGERVELFKGKKQRQEHQNDVQSWRSLVEFSAEYVLGSS